MGNTEYLGERPHVRRDGVYEWPELADKPPTFESLHQYAIGLRYTDKALREFLAHWTTRCWEGAQGWPLHDAKLLLRHYAQDQIAASKWTNR